MNNAKFVNWMLGIIAALVLAAAGASYSMVGRMATFESFIREQERVNAEQKTVNAETRATLQRILEKIARIEPRGKDGD